MAKREPVVVLCDDFELDGYHLHEGETVTIYPAITAADSKLTHDLMVAQTKLEAAKGDPDEWEQTITWVDQLNSTICEKLAKRVIAWTWTDEEGKPLPQPDRTPAPFLALEQPEVMYLWGKSLARESPAAAKNGLRPSPTT